MKLNKYWYLKTRRELYELVSQVGADVDYAASYSHLIDAHSNLDDALTAIQDLCIEMGWLDPDTLEEI